MNKTFPQLRKQVLKTLGNGSVIHHVSTPENPLGQSGIHTFVADVIEIVLSSENESDAWRNLHKYFEG